MNVFKQARKVRQIGLFVAIIMTAVFSLSSCTFNKAKNSDVVTHKATAEGKTQITVLVKNAFSIHVFEEKLEKRFPNIDLVQVGNYTCDMGIAEYAARLEHDDIPDMVMTWPLDVGEEYFSDRLIDLSGMEFTNRYKLSMLNSISKDGKLYYLPGPAQIRGIVYNKTLFREKGWELPKDFKGFLKLCKTIEESGIRSIQLGFQNSEVLDTAFIGYNFGNYYSHPQDFQWMDNYNQGIGSFGEHFSGALDVFKEMIDAGVWKPADLTVDYSVREKMLFSRKCAMTEDSVLMTKIGYSRTGSTDEFALMPFFNPGSENDWARLYMVCYVGLNKHLEEPANKEKYDLVMDIMEYILTPDGQEAMAADTGAMFSSLTNMPLFDSPEVEALLPVLSSGRYAIFPTLENAQSALREGLAGMLKGTMTKEEVIKLVDEQNKNPAVDDALKVLGKAKEDFSLTETGNYIADTLRKWGDTDIALYLDNGKDGKTNGKGVSARLYQGDITVTDVSRIMPDLRFGDQGRLWKVTINGKNLLKVLEESVNVENNLSGWFYYVSGLRLEFDPIAVLGSRVSNVTTADGKAIDPASKYTVVVTEGSIKEEYLESCEKTSEMAYDVVTKSILDEGTISPSKDGRMNIK